MLIYSLSAKIAPHFNPVRKCAAGVKQCRHVCVCVCVCVRLCVSAKK